MKAKRSKPMKGPLRDEFDGDPYPHAVLSPEGLYLGSAAGWETANLWQAAPDLLAALVAWQNAYEAGELEKYDDAFKAARAAIAKAEGRQPTTNG